MAEPRAYTEEEVKGTYLKMVASYVDYWATLKLPPSEDTPRRRLEGLAFSLLVILDGGSVTLPGFTVSPLPSDAEDKKYLVENEENFYPENLDIAGSLHDNVHKYFKHCCTVSGR